MTTPADTGFAGCTWYRILIDDSTGQLRCSRGLRRSAWRSIVEQVGHDEHAASGMQAGLLAERQGSGGLPALPMCRYASAGLLPWVDGQRDLSASLRCSRSLCPSAVTDA